MVVTITAKNIDTANELRDEIVGAIEDNNESGFIAAEATADGLVEVKEGDKP